jgi:N-acetylglucosaminyldiphosphoundecaprenol N-acetyl-beta-D-mannosaminyltransferase
MAYDVLASDNEVLTKGLNAQAKSLDILGVPISIIDMERTLAEIDRMFATGRGGYICIRDTHGVMLAQNDPHLREIHERAALVTPDGMPLVLLARLYGHSDIGRVCGPDLVMALCGHSLRRNYRHYFFGSTPEVSDAFLQRLRTIFPGICISGSESPPFGPVTTEPDQSACRRIQETNANIIWVGLGTPKQEYWMAANAPLLPNTVMIGVGAAFDFHACTIKRAPLWMQKSCLEWLYRLIQEPRRLWKRYLIIAPKFVVLSLLEWITRLRSNKSS